MVVVTRASTYGATYVRRADPYTLLLLQPRYNSHLSTTGS